SRARKTAAELDPSGSGRAALEALVRGRLLVASEAGGETAYELAHEALIVGWATLRGWLSSDAAARAARQRLAIAATEWDRLGRHPGLLGRARQIEQLERRDDASLEEPQRSFIQASRRAARRRRAGMIGAVLAAVLFSAGVYGVLKLQARASLASTIAARRAP